MRSSFQETLYIDSNQEFKGSYQAKYLQLLENDNSKKHDKVSTKLTALEYLDELINEPIPAPSFKNSINSFDLLKNMEDRDASFDYTKLSLLEKIKCYTNSILPQSKFTFHEIQDILYKDALEKDKFTIPRFNNWLKIKEQFTTEELTKLGISDSWFNFRIEKLRKAKIAHNLVSSIEIKNTLTHLKFFSSFFLKPEYDNMILDSINEHECLDHCSTISTALFDIWLTGKLPTFKKFKKFMEEEILDLHPKKVKNCFIKLLHSNMHGKGIVLTANDRLVPELLGLLALLRLTGNTYPIQIFYNGDISKESMKLIMDVGQFENLKLHSSSDINKNTIPIVPLDITFVDISNTITSKYMPYYSRYGMKLLAYLFSTFEEIVMLDTDTVVLKPIKFFFESPKYISTNGYFFKDRELNAFIHNDIIEHMKSYLNEDDEAHYLNLPRVTQETLQNRFFGGNARHYLESGLFVINRKEKFDGVIASVILQVFKLFTDSTHGEKEFIWLGQEIMGNSYSVNLHAAIPIGELSPDLGTVSHELCSTHPGHIDDDGKTLLWFNSGFLTCKKTGSYEYDFGKPRYEGKSLLELKNLYEGPLHITHGLVPPPAEFKVDSSNGEPSRGWLITDECSFYTWCGYDIIGGLQHPGIPKGEVISFRDEETRLWDYYGKIWVNYFNVGQYLIGEGTQNGESIKYEDIELDEDGIFKVKSEKEKIVVLGHNPQ